MKNNFDKCSYMESIELDIFFDSDSAQILFECFFETLEKSNRYDSYLFYTSGGEFEKPNNISDLYDFSKCSDDDFKNFVKSKIKNPSDDELEDAFELTKEILNEEYSFKSILTKSEIPCINNAIPLYTVYRVTGHSQGEVSYILVNNKIEYSSNFRNDLENLIYNQPLKALLKVDSNEYYLEEHLKDVYNYDKEQILKVCQEKLQLSEKVLEWLKNNLPKYPETY